jgi:hypothetical protein
VRRMFDKISYEVDSMICIDNYYSQFYDPFCDEFTSFTKNNCDSSYLVYVISCLKKVVLHIPYFKTDIICFKSYIHISSTLLHIVFDISYLIPDISDFIFDIQYFLWVFPTHFSKFQKHWWHTI